MASCVWLASWHVSLSRPWYDNIDPCRLCTVLSSALPEVGKLPVMGYDTYNAFEADFDGALAIEQGRLMEKYGLVDAGYDVRAVVP